MNPYPSYNDSGVEWIGKVPNEWSIVKYKSLGENIVDNIGTEDFKDKKVIHYSIPNVQSFGKGVMELGNDIKSSKLLFKGGELIISKLNPRKSTVCIVEEFEDNIILGSGEFVVLYPKIMDSKYLYYFVITSKYTDFLDSCVESVTRSHQRVNPSIIYNSYIPNPSEIEQTQIVSFLDTKTQKIDELIEKTEQKIKLLKEKRTSLINHCVTKGLNPDVKMKDSGVEWIGEIPRDWKLLKFWLIISSSDLGGNYNCSSEYEGYPVMKMGNLGRGSINLKKIEYIDNNSNVDKNHILQNGDFLFNTRNSKELVGKVSLWKNELPISIYNSNILRICFNKNVSNDYMNYLFNSNSILDVLKMISKGTTNVSGIYFKDLSNIYICLPSKHEQTQIVEYLDEQTQRIDSTIEKETQRIELLKEYRQSLISEVVTGKVDVRDYNG